MYRASTPITDAVGSPNIHFPQHSYLHSIDAVHSLANLSPYNGLQYGICARLTLVNCYIH